MASNVWLPLATTALGAVLAVGGGGIAQWAGNRRSDSRGRDERRHAAYAEFIAAADELTRMMRSWYPTKGYPSFRLRRWPLPHQTIEFRQTLAAILGNIDRAAVAVTLAGPRTAAEAAGAVRAKGWEMFRWWLRSGPHQELRALDNEYVALCDTFTAVARAILRTDTD